MSVAIHSTQRLWQTLNPREFTDYREDSVICTVAQLFVSPLSGALPDLSTGSFNKELGYDNVGSAYQLTPKNKYTAFKQIGQVGELPHPLVFILVANEIRKQCWYCAIEAANIHHSCIVRV